MPILFKSHPSTISNSYSYKISLIYESDCVSLTSRSSAMVNGKVLKCMCGGDPMLIMIVYGHIQAFCWRHIPEIDININSDCRSSHE